MFLLFSKNIYITGICSDTFNIQYGTHQDLYNMMRYTLCCAPSFTVYILFSVVGHGGCTMQALQQHGGHGGNHCLQLLGRLHGNYTGDAGKENRGAGGVYFKTLTVVGYIRCSPFGSHMSYKFKFANKLYKGNSATSLCQP